MIILIELLALCEYLLEVINLVEENCNFLWAESINLFFKNFSIASNLREVFTIRCGISISSKSCLMKIMIESLISLWNFLSVFFKHLNLSCQNPCTSSYKLFKLVCRWLMFSVAFSCRLNYRKVFERNISTWEWKQINNWSGVVWFQSFYTAALVNILFSLSDLGDGTIEVIDCLEEASANLSLNLSTSCMKILEFTWFSHSLDLVVCSE